MSSKTKLVASAVTLGIVLVIAAIAQRSHRPADPFLARQESSRNREVFGSEPAKPIPTATEPELSSAPPPPAQAAAEPAPSSIKGSNDVPADILGFLERWRASLITGDVATHVATYAPRMERFFRQRNVSRDAVRKEKERMLRIYPDFNRYEIRDVKLESRKGDRAVVTFTKDWDASGVRRFAGSERQRLGLQKRDGTWQIVREEELKVFWVRR